MIEIIMVLLLIGMFAGLIWSDHETQQSEEFDDN